MKKLVLLSIIVTGVFSVPAQTTTQANSKNKIAAVKADVKIDPLGLIETEFDFGGIPQGKPVTHRFEVTNVGKDSLTIVSVQASCGCTTPEWEIGKSFLPGEKTYITVGFNAAAVGKFTKDITVIYNNNKSKQIIIKGDVWQGPASSVPENKQLNELKDL